MAKKEDTTLAQVFHSDLFGKREAKYEFLNNNSLKTIAWNTLEASAPNHFFVNKNFDVQTIYDKGFKVNELFPLNNVGIVTSKDAILINDNKESLIKNVSEYYSIRPNASLIKRISYRPFDEKFVYYDVKIIERAREKLMKHMFSKDNIAFVTVNRQPLSNPTTYYFLSKSIITNGFIRSDSVSIDNLMPLYLYPETTDQQTLDQKNERTPNLNAEIIWQIAEKLGLIFTNEKETTKDTFAPIDILDYIYAVLHSPTYREKYKEFLKIDFPRVPYPKGRDTRQCASTFWQLVKLGGEIRQIHLLESPIVEKYITQYPEDGNNVVTKPTYQNGRVYINETQYFDNVPDIAWDFYIGGYQPAQKWLKDRKERALEFDDILHYQKIIVALSETDRIMKEIDKIEIE